MAKIEVCNPLSTDNPFSSFTISASLKQCVVCLTLMVSTTNCCNHHTQGWRRNEYKLMMKETYFKQTQDGRLTVTEGQSLQDFPVLVHYFWKKCAFTTFFCYSSHFLQHNLLSSQYTWSGKTEKISTLTHTNENDVKKVSPPFHRALPFLKWKEVLSTV
jgi:hypothetical protein